MPVLHTGGSWFKSKSGDYQDHGETDIIPAYEAGVEGSNPSGPIVGVVAQLGERLLCMQDVGSSSLPDSICIFENMVYALIR